MGQVQLGAREAAMLRRSYLFVPGNRLDRVPKAAASGADALIIDLEDSVPESQVPAARDELLIAVRLARKTSAVPVYVRVNSGRDVSLDVAAAVAAGADGVMVPKVEAADTVTSLEALLCDAELRFGSKIGSTEMLVLVESARGVIALGAIASAGSRITGIGLGVEDLATDLEVDPHAVGFDVSWAHGLLICHARANGIAPFGLLGTLTEIRDLEKLEADAHRSRAFGYVGALCIHPAQVPSLHRAFTPTHQEVQQARAILDLLEVAGNAGTAAAQIGGRMVDTPMVMRARRLLLRAEGVPGRRSIDLPIVTTRAGKKV